MRTSAILNFAKFREERLAMYQNLCAERERAAETLRRSQAGGAELRTQVAAARADNAEDEAAIAEAEAQLGVAEGEIGSLNEQQAEARGESSELKRVAHELKVGKE